MGLCDENDHDKQQLTIKNTSINLQQYIVKCIVVYMCMFYVCALVNFLPCFEGGIHKQYWPNYIK